MPNIIDDSILLRLVLDNRKFRREVNDTKRALGQLDDEMDDVSNNSAPGLGRAFSSVGDIIKGNLLTGAIVGLVGGLRDVAGGMFDAAVSAEQTQVSFETFLGSAEAANEVIERLNQFSVSTPFEPSQVLEAGKSLLAFGIDVENLEDSLRAIGDVSAGTGKDFNELAVIFGKAKVQGTLFAEDINQLTEAGVPIIQEFAKQLGVSESQVKKLASEGKISFDNLNQAFQDLTSEGGKFFDLTAKQSQTIGGLLSTLRGSATAAGKDLVQAFFPFIRTILVPVIEMMGEFSQIVRPVAQGISTTLTSAFEFLGRVLEPVRENFALIRESFGNVAEIVQSRLNPNTDFLAQVLFSLGNAAEKVSGFFAAALNIPIVQQSVALFIGVLSEVPAIFNGIVEASAEFVNGIIRSFTITKLQAELLIQGVKGIFSAEARERADAIRAQIDDASGQGRSLLEAFADGYDEANKQKLTVPEVDQPKAVEQAKITGGKVGKEMGKAFGKELSKEAKKARDKFEKEVKQAERLLEDLRISAIEDPNERTSAELQLDAKRRIEGLFGTPEQIKEQRQFIENELNAQLRTLQNRPADQIQGSAPSLITGLDAAVIKEQAEEGLQIVAEMKARAGEILANTDIAGESSATLFDQLLGTASIEDIREKALEVADLAFNLASDNQRRIIEGVDVEIEQGERRLEELKRLQKEENAANTEQIQAEEENLLRLQRAKEQALEKERKIAAAQQAINSAVAVGNAIAAAISAFKTSPILGLIQIAALGASIAGLVSSVNNLFSSAPVFHEGTDSVGAGSHRSDNFNRQLLPGERRAIVQDGELILDKENSAMFRAMGFSREDIVPLGKMAKLGPITRTGKLDAQLLQITDNSKELKQLILVNNILVEQNDQLLKHIQHERTTFNVTEKGIWTAAQRYKKRQQRIRK